MGSHSWRVISAAVLQVNTEATKEKHESLRTPGNRRDLDDRREVSARREVLLSQS